MKRICCFGGMLAFLLGISCSKDGEMLTASLPGEDGISIGSTDTEIVLDKDNPSALALTLYWDAMGDLTLSNPDAQIADDAVTQTLQFASEESFSAPYEALMITGATSVQYTVSQLNSIVSRLGFESGVASTLYVRMKTQLGANSEPRYGNVLQFTVTPYFVDMSQVAIRSKESGTDVATIPALSDGEYAGLMMTTVEWFSFYFVEGDGTIWGTLNDGDTGEAFALQQTTDLSSWDCWFPEPTGCYYVTMSTSEAEWTATCISEPSVQAGDDSYGMTYHKAQNTWSCVFTTASDNAAIGLVQSGSLYNRSTGASDGSVPVECTLSLVAGADGSLTVAEGQAASGLTAGAAGTYTLLLDLTNRTLTLAEGEVSVDDGEEEEEEEWPEDLGYTVPTGDKIYIYDVDSDKNPTAVAGTLVATSSGVYEGFFYLDGWYNFKLGDTDDLSTAKIYGSAPIPNDAGLYRLYADENMYALWYDSDTGAYCYLVVDFNERTWSREVVTSLEVLGSFNNYTLGSNEMTFDTATRTWTTTIQAADWGSGFYLLLNDDWNRCYTDPDLDGRLEFHSWSTGSEFLPAGLETDRSYRLTVDLNDPENLTYTIVADESGGESAADYPEVLYAYYCDEGKSIDQMASKLISSGTDGHYAGYVSTSSSWDDVLYTHFVFSDSALPDNGTVYGTLPGSQFVLDTSESSYTAWFTNLGLNRVTVDLTTGTWTEAPLSIAVTGDFNNWSLTADPMTFDLTTLTWQATCDISTIGYGVQIVLGSNWDYVYGGTDGVLVKADNNNNIQPAETGTYFITVDLRDAGNLTYTLTKQE